MTSVTRFQYLVRAPQLAGSHAADYDAFTEAVRHAAAGCADGEAVTLTWTKEAPPRLSVVPFVGAPLAVISVRADSEPNAPQLPAGYRVAGYEVGTSVPLPNARDWPEGDTPGVSLLTCFRRKPGLDDARFFHRWYDVHGPLGERIHPLWAYVRNRVRRPLGDAPPLDAIVEEQMRSREDLVNPLRFFGGPLRMVPNMIREWLDVRSFIDFNHFEAYLASEWRVRG